MGILRTDKISGLETPTAVTGSVSFDGTGDYLTLSTSGDFNYGTGDFTWEVWVYVNSFSGNRYVLDHDSNGGTISNGGSGNTKFHYYNSTVAGSVLNTTGFGQLSTSTWYHLAAVRKNGTTSLYTNGILTVSASDSHNYGTPALSIGRYGGGGNEFDGYISNLRILKGTALYTSDFTPPTHELEKIGDTVLLCCNNPVSAGAEATGKTITVNGNAAASTVSPGLTRDFTFGTQFEGVTRFDTQGYFVPPSGTTEQQFPNFAGAPASSARGLFGGGANPFPTKLNIIDYITIATTGNAQEFGDLTVARGAIFGCSSNVRGVFAGGASPSNDNTIDYVTISSTGDAKDFGDLTVASYSGSGASNSTRGVFALGQAPSHSNIIDFITISTGGNGLKFGDLSQLRDQMGSCASSTRGLFAGGLITPSPVTLTNIIDYVNISSTGNAVDFGDLLQGGSDGIRRCGGLSNATRGLFAGGESTPTGQKDIISFITMASLGDAQDFGDLSDGASQSDNGASSSVRGVFHLTSPANTTLHFLTINTLGNSNDFGDMTSSSTLNGLSNGHGGLG